MNLRRASLALLAVLLSLVAGAAPARAVADDGADLAMSVIGPGTAYTGSDVYIRYFVTISNAAPPPDGAGTIDVEIVRPRFGTTGAPALAFFESLSGTFAPSPDASLDQSRLDGDWDRLVVRFDYTEAAPSDSYPMFVFELRWTVSEGRPTFEAVVGDRITGANGTVLLDPDPTYNTAASTVVVTDVPDDGPPPPPPPPAGPSADAFQDVTTTITGTLSIDVDTTTLAFGTLAGLASATVDVGTLRYTNTLADGSPWSVTVRASELATAGGSTIAYDSLTFSPGAAGDLSETVGPSPDAGPAGPFTGTGLLSDPRTVLQADAALQGSLTQTGSTLRLDVPVSPRSGDYAGTLQYTILG